MTRSLRLIFGALLLIVPIGLVAAPAVARDPIPGPTVLSLYFVTYGNDDHAGQTLKAHAFLNPAVGSNEYGDPTGTVSFSVGDGVPVVYGHDGADKDFTIPSDSPFTVTAHFNGTNGWPDSEGTATFTPLFHKIMTAEPTIVRTGPGGKLTLNFETHVTNSYGAGRPGELIYFSLLGYLPDNLADTPPTPYLAVCHAYTDATGLAKCAVPAVLPAIVSILSAGGFASLWEPNAAGYRWINLPVIIRG